MLDKHRTSSTATLPETHGRVPCRPAEARRTVERVMTERCRDCRVLSLNRLTRQSVVKHPRC
ncbi:hypothetical protein ACWDE9_46020, partial [Streptomyces olivaceoviridis]